MPRDMSSWVGLESAATPPAPITTLRGALGTSWVWITWPPRDLCRRCQAQRVYSRGTQLTPTTSFSTSSRTPTAAPATAPVGLVIRSALTRATRPLSRRFNRSGVNSTTLDHQHTPPAPGRYQVPPKQWHQFWWYPQRYCPR